MVFKLTNKNGSSSTPWWKGASIYQVYPRSFCDSTGNGVGDLLGIREKLGHISSLGVDAIWVSPFFKSPMADFGYDIADYRNVDPLFGNLDDFKAMLATAKDLSLKVIVDQVLSHTSDTHEWFVESRADQCNPKADWYVWADPKPDGTAPNNWLSLFGGQAWTWDSRRQQYYLHNFLSSQPDLNFHNSEVRKAQLENARFWLEMGVDGFRFDVVNFYYHDKGLRDNPCVLDSDEKSLAVSSDNPYGMQRHKFDITQSENIGFITDLRSLLDKYPDTTSIGEISDDWPLETMAAYTSGGDKLHMAYTFDLLDKQFSADYVRSVISRIESSIGDGWPCWALSNHDVERHNSRWSKSSSAEFAKMSLAMLLSMRGSACLYQGDELGLPQADVSYEQLQDPYGFPFWPEYKGRDGCRTPMPWDSTSGAGFTRSESWLPIPDRHKELSVATQATDPLSVLSFCQAFIKWRNTQPALTHGDIKLFEDTGDALCWIREAGNQQLFVAINTTESTQQVELPFLDGIVNLPPLQVAYFERL